MAVLKHGHEWLPSGGVSQFVFEDETAGGSCR